MLLFSSTITVSNQELMQAQLDAVFCHTLSLSLPPYLSFPLSHTTFPSPSLFLSLPTIYLSLSFFLSHISLSFFLSPHISFFLSPPSLSHISPSPVYLSLFPISPPLSHISISLSSPPLSFTPLPHSTHVCECLFD